MDGLLYSRCNVRRSMFSWSASHWLVWPERRSSSRMMWPMCICIVVADCALGYRIPIYTPAAADKKEGEQSRLQSAAVESTFRNRQNARLSASICTLSFLNDLD